MPLFETINIDKEKLKEIALKYYNVELGDIVKASQNHTFLTKSLSGDEKKYVLRATPDPTKSRVESTKLEVKLLDYLYDNKLPVCKTVSNLIDGQGAVFQDDLIICLFNFASGEPVNYIEWKWLDQSEIIIGLGKWFGELHKLTRQFSKQYPEYASKARHWQTVHDGILKSVDVNPLDLELTKDSNLFNVIHGDVNPSNYFWDSSISMPSMFDWDQCQLSWLSYDLSAPLFGVWSLETFGNNNEPVPSANLKQYTEYLLQGYESAIGEKVDRDHLERMVEIRRQLYIRFCKAAVVEFSDKPDYEKNPMYIFCKTMTDRFNKLYENK